MIMKMTKGKKLGLIFVFVLILLSVLIITNWHVGIETKRLTGKARADSAVLTTNAKDIQTANMQAQQEKLEKDLNAISSIVDKGRFINLAIGIISCAAILLLVYFSILRINKNIKSILDFTATLVRGDFTSSLAIKSKDEIAQIADQLTALNIQTGNVFKDITNGISTLNANSDNLFNSSESMKETAENNSRRTSDVADEAENMSDNMNSVAAASEQVTTNINMVASSAEEMSATINEIAKNTETARVVTDKAVTQTR
ncbi:MAG: methyl-accepting chemotaxis protein, partial [Deltaproteobacteria bacterium]|nr:methyl-accepting chemotaxis protein [Deltaproteobacteria bacterium]